MTSRTSTSQILIRLVLSYLVMGAVVFWSAGTIHWPAAWLYLIIQASFSISEAAWLKRNNPELLKERMTFLKSSAKGWDKAFMWISTLAYIPYLVLPGLDAVRYQWSVVPVAVQVAGFAGVVVSLGLVLRVLRENPFLYRIVEVQMERNHRVITTGPYRYVRHPMYSGVLVMFVSVPLALGSFWTLIPAAILVVLILSRTLLEEETLFAELEGYSAYAERVRYRVLPRVW